MPHHDPAADSSAVTALLQARRAEILVELAQLEQPAADVGGISFGKRVGDGTSIAVERITQVAAHDRLQAVMEEVDRAEAKVGEASYGVCDSCGKEIASARLEARPWSTHCVDCA